MKDHLLALAAFSTLAACGGSGSGPTVITVPAEFNTFGDSDVDVELTPSGDIIAVTKSGGPAAVGTDTAPDFSTFRTAIDASGDYTIAFASASSTSTAGGAVYQDGADETSGVFYERIGETDLPTTGSASFSGDYVGMLTFLNTGGTVEGVGFTGEVLVNVDFENALVDGAITDRALVTLTDLMPLDDSSVADLMLTESELEADGSFGGIPTGGEFTVDGDVSSIGPIAGFEGLIAGTDATEAVGGVFVPHSFDGDNFVEVGAFAAGH